MISVQLHQLIMNNLKKHSYLILCYRIYIL
uniref:Uncharacterized protein n=1 Tax=Arundo donax TaxID=35708 RepID=A0A0A8ZA74_ARUDO